MKDELDEKLDAALVTRYLRRQALLRELLKTVLPSGRVSGGKSATLTPEQYEVILVLDAYGHGVTMKEISEAVIAPHANVTRTLERLEKKGLVYRTKGSDDRRQVIVRLTLTGSKLAREMRLVSERLYERLWGCYSDEEKGRLLALLTR